jgi:hypothetical protein
MEQERLPGIITVSRHRKSPFSPKIGVGALRIDRSAYYEYGSKLV